MKLFSSDNEIGSADYKVGSTVENFMEGNSYPLRMELPMSADIKKITKGKSNSIGDYLYSIRTPSKKQYDDIPFSSTFFNSLFAGLKGLFFSNPMAFIWKLVSLVFQPLYFGIALFLFFYLYMERGITYSFIRALLPFYIEALRQSIVCISHRPTLKEVIVLFTHQHAALWLVWVFGSSAYALNKANTNNTETAYEVGMIVGFIAYWFIISNVFSREGAGNLLKYLYQILAIIITTAIAIGFGYTISASAWSWIFSSEPIFLRRYVVAMFFGFFGFWIAVNQFYIPDVAYLRMQERGEELLELQ
jgi:hypothetical protein